MRKLSLIFIVMLMVGGVGFYAGVKYGQSQQATGRPGGNFANLSPEERQARMGQFGAMIGSGGQRGPRGDGGFSAGEIMSKDDRSITLKLRDGGSRIIFFSSSTAISKSAAGSAADLKTGGEVAITGTANPDGSVTAQSIQIKPIGQSN